MAITANNAVRSVPQTYDIQVDHGSAFGTVNFGDFLIYSGNAVIPTAMGALAHVKSSAAGVALESNPQYDTHGRVVTASALRFARGVVLRVSANFSGQIPLGTPVFPAATGSGVAAPTGLTGVGATWGTAPAVANSANALGSGVGYVSHWYSVGNGGTGEMDIVLPVPRHDYY